jgi:uncharacterized protein (DUF58 family)
MPANQPPALSEEKVRAILRRVRSIELRTRRLVNNQMLGSYHSAFKGQGLLFDEIREYVAGDDVRSIDWNVTARMDRPFLKKYQEEREMTLLLGVDISASTDFGSSLESKRELAAEIACLLAVNATRNQDKVGLMLFAEGVEEWLPPRKGQQHVLRIVRDVLFRQSQTTRTDLAQSIEEATRLLHRRSVMFFLTDAFENNDLEHGADPLSPEFLKALQKASVRHEVIVGLIHDPRELDLPRLGRVVLRDPETGEKVLLKARSDRDRARYAAWVAAEEDRRLRLIRRTGADVLRFRTDEPYDRVLERFFRGRRPGLRR